MPFPEWFSPSTWEPVAKNVGVAGFLISVFNVWKQRDRCLVAIRTYQAKTEGEFGTYRMAVTNTGSKAVSIMAASYAYTELSEEDGKDRWIPHEVTIYRSGINEPHFVQPNDTKVIVFESSWVNAAPEYVEVVLQNEAVFTGPLVRGESVNSTISAVGTMLERELDFLNGKVVRAHASFEIVPEDFEGPRLRFSVSGGKLNGTIGRLANNEPDLRASVWMTTIMAEVQRAVPEFFELTTTDRDLVLGWREGANETLFDSERMQEIRQRYGLPLRYRTSPYVRFLRGKRLRDKVKAILHNMPVLVARRSNFKRELRLLKHTLRERRDANGTTDSGDA